MMSRPDRDMIRIQNRSHIMGMHTVQFEGHNAVMVFCFL